MLLTWELQQQDDTTDLRCTTGLGLGLTEEGCAQARGVCDLSEQLALDGEAAPAH